MLQNNKTRNMIFMIAVSISAFFLMTGCASFSNSTCPGQTAGIQNEGYRVTDNNLSDFMSSVRPINGEVDSFYRLARYFQEKGKYNLAVEELKKAITIDPGNVKAYNALGVSYDSLGQFDLAVKCYSLALKVNHDLDYVYNNMGYSHLLNGNIDGAISAFKKAIILNDQDKRYHNNLGLAYTRIKQMDLAYSEFMLAGSETRAMQNIVRLGGNLDSLNREKSLFIEPLDDTVVKNGMAMLADSQDLPVAGKAETVVKKDEIETSAPAISQEEIPSDTQKKILTGPPKTLDVSELPKNDVCYTVQVGAFRNIQNAEKIIQRLQRKGFENLYVKKVGADNPYYRVRLGGFEDQGKADTLSTMLRSTTSLKTFTAVESRPVEITSTGMPNIVNASLKYPAVKTDFDIEISNGNGVRRMAKRVGNYLSVKGFKVTRLTNANRFNFPKTQIYYRKGHFQDALRLARELLGQGQIEDIMESEQIGRKVKVLIGKDLIPFDGKFKEITSNQSV
jgi:Flp pilus assembly protein TadD/cell division septation protein DedD/uncharacterized protein YceK